LGGHDPLADHESGSWIARGSVTAHLENRIHPIDHKSEYLAAPLRTVCQLFPPLPVEIRLPDAVRIKRIWGRLPGKKRVPLTAAAI
jgi:hypothetical protein